MNDEHDAVWAETTDGGLLRQMFGFYPTLYDASILSFSYDRVRCALGMLIDYEDEAEGDEPLCVRISMMWAGVQGCDLAFDDDVMVGMHFHRSSGGMTTTFGLPEGGVGLTGRIVSERVEATLVGVDPHRREAEGRLHFRLE